MKKKRLRTEIVIVGSGAGGATLAKELSERGREVIVVEKGGESGSRTRFSDKSELCVKSNEGLGIFRAFGIGGTTAVSCGNAVRSLEKELGILGINLSSEFRDAEKDLGVRPVPAGLLGNGTRKIMEAARKSGVIMERMPKAIDWKECRRCGKCLLGCCYGAKWTAGKYLRQAESSGVKVLKRVEICEVLTSGGNAVGVRGRDGRGDIFISAEKVILAAGGLVTPAILQRSGVSAAGGNLFVDLQQTIYGVVKDGFFKKEIYMSAVSYDFLERQGFILSPFVDVASDFFSTTLSARRIPGVLSRKSIFGIIAKIKDENTGKISRAGEVSKEVSSKDRDKLRKAAAISGEILIRAGVIPASLVVSPPEGAHPGGGAAIGRVVDKNQETGIKGLFVSDASVLPFSSGLPPILTVVALSKRLASRQF
ncbi:MAG: FAD-dependent oxidoreductase [Candidatus Omnitrophica bacterium]|jgi:choline dehydrogenase-like flavoprotein|nr:FAD-dependent oxidoreductase [Candidatus Omnitrophota bacterium]